MTHSTLTFPRFSFERGYDVIWCDMSLLGMIKMGPKPELQRSRVICWAEIPASAHLSWNVLCAFSGVPSPPSAIALLLCTGTEMVLGWRAPACNGGDPIRGYYLDQREFGLPAWREVNVKPTTERKFKVSVSPYCWCHGDVTDSVLIVDLLN